jgi:hypothetical protein
VKLRNHELDGAALHEDGDKDDEQGGGEEDVLEDGALVKNGHQRKSYSASQTSVGKNKLLLKKKHHMQEYKNIKSKKTIKSKSGLKIIDTLTVRVF